MEYFLKSYWSTSPAGLPGLPIEGHLDDGQQESSSGRHLQRHYIKRIHCRESAAETCADDVDSLLSA